MHTYRVYIHIYTYSLNEVHKKIAHILDHRKVMYAYMYVGVR